MYLQISNRGLVEAGALSLMGASVKTDGAVGKFGSGFKYALATLIRCGVTPRVFSGETELVLETRPEVFRSETFDVLWIDGVRTSITTRTGHEWKLRDAIREVWSNARDEGGEDWKVESQVETHLDRTVIAIPLNRAIEEMIANWEMYFCETVPALYSSSRGRILSQPVTNFFRRGVWICEDRERVPLFSYDFEEIDLPESRKIKTSSTSYEVFSLLNSCNNETVWEKIIDNIDGQWAEIHSLNFWTISKDSIGGLTAHTVFNKKWDYFGQKKFQDKIKTSGQRVLWVNEMGARTLQRLGFDDIAHAVDFSTRFSIEPWPIGYQDKLETPLTDLARCGVDMSKFPIRYIRFYEDNGDNPIALAHKGQCLLTNAAFEASPQMLRKALIEEWTHLQHNVPDNSVAQQHVYLNLIVDLMERIK